jgi:hypothetical protein
MGLFSFMKKKPSDQLALPPGDQSLTTDLPSIDGQSLNTTPFDDSSVQQFGGIHDLPSLDDSGKEVSESKSLSFSIPPLDFSMPESDDIQSLKPRTDDQLPHIPALPGALPSQDPNSDAISPEDINKLFVNDETWKEPDWANFDPYPAEEKIDEPKSEDFRGADLPQFEDTSSGIMTSDEPVSLPAEPFPSKPRGSKPLELFIRGKEYNRVFVELDQMSQSLFKIDSQVNNYEEMLKREEPLLLSAKDQMEYLYRKLSLIDKKIFVQ